MKREKIHFEDLVRGGGIKLGRKGPLKGDFSYPIVEVSRLDAAMESHPSKPYPRLHVEIEAELVVRDSRDDARFPYSLSFVENLDAMKEEDDTGEGIIFPEEGLSLEEIAMGLIHMRLPIRLEREGSRLPPSGDFYTVSEEDGE